MMKIGDIETVNEAGCGTCGYPLCPDSVVEHQSITVTACGESIPEHEDVPAEDRCLIFKRVKDSVSILQSFSGPNEGGGGQSGSQTDTTTCQFDYVWKTVEPEEEGDAPTRVCEAEQRSQYTLSGNITNYAGGEVESTSTSSGSSSSGPSSPCSGSISSQTSYPGEEPEEPNVEPYNVCLCPPVLNLNNPDVEYTSVGSFVLATTDDITGGTSSTTWSREFSEPVTLADLKDELEARVAMYGEEHDWPGAETNSKVEYILGYPDPPEGEEPDPSASPVCRQVERVTLHRYRRGVPLSYSTEALPRTVFKERWQDWWFPTVWDLWDTAKGLYEEWEVAHAAWEEAGADPDTEPVEPPEPGAEPEAKPELIAEREWIWGGNMENRWSPYFIQDLPEDPEEPGMVRSVNMGRWCYASTRTGTKPQIVGEIYVPPPEEEEEP